MVALYFPDTRDVLAKLTEAGLPLDQANFIVDVFKEAQLTNVATRGDLQSIRAEIAALREEFSAAIHELGLRVMKMLLFALLAQAGLVTTLVKLL